MPVFPHSCAMCLQQSRSTAVIAAPGIVHAMTGRATSSSATAEKPTLAASFTNTSLVPTLDSRQQVDNRLECPAFRSRYRANLRSPSLQPGGYLGSAVAANSSHKLGAAEEMWWFTFR